MCINGKYKIQKPSFIQLTKTSLDKNLYNFHQTQSTAKESYPDIKKTGKFKIQYE